MDIDIITNNLDVNCKNNSINYYFIGNKEDIRQNSIFKYFDTNYIPLNNILLSYYPTLSSKSEDNDFIALLNKLNDNKKIYNNYNIYPIFISILIIIIALLILSLRILFIYYYHLYTYVLAGIILFLIIIGSIWFIYINNETL
jgi:hypothetical protein